MIKMNNTQDNMNNETIRLRGSKQPGAKDRPPNTKIGQGQVGQGQVGQGRGRYNKGSFKR